MSERAGQDHRDLTIEELASQEHRLARELAAVRAVLHVALGQLHERDGQIDRLREQLQRLRDEYHGLRESILRVDRKAA